MLQEMMIKKKKFKTLTMEGALDPVLIKRPLESVEGVVGMKDKRGDICKAPRESIFELVSSTR